MTQDSILGRVMLAFEGERVPRWVARRLAAAPAAGMTLFRFSNVRSPGQVRELTGGFQRAGVESSAGPARGPLLVAADQEGGQLLALGPGTTEFAGNMALGAVGDEDLAERVGAAIGREARAMGVNVVYAPVLDLATEPNNTSLGIRSLGDDPAEVGRLGAAIVRGLQGAGVAATLKHFPGLGAVAQDSHHGLGVVHGSREALETLELVPFRAAIAAGARVAMSAHVAAPGLSGDPNLPATLSRAVMDGVLRGELGFGGVTISDALDMRALAQGAAQVVEIVAAVRAGVDLLLCSPDRRAQRRIEETLVAAAGRGLFDTAKLDAAASRIDALRAWLADAGPQPGLDVVGSATHRALSRELAERALTRTDGPAGGVHAPLAIPADARILAVMPEPTDLTPADTSSSVAPGLGRALRTRFTTVEEVVVGVAPGDDEIAALRARAAAADVDVVVVGTIEAHRQPAQAELVRAIAATGTATVAVALRTPWDVATYPTGVPAICTYSILPDSLEALARALAREIGFPGRLPVAVSAAIPR